MGKQSFSVTPYAVSGAVDYDRLIKEFGVSRIDEQLLKRIEKHTGELHFMLRRGVFFAHRDMNWILDEYEKGNKFFLYTGRAPSGPVHVGHLLPWVFTKWLQVKFDVDLWFQFPDEEKFLFKQDVDYEEIQKWLEDNMLDVIAVGFNPEKTHFLIDTRHAGLMYPEAVKVARKITYSMVRASFGFNESTNVGSLFYTTMQAVPAFLPSVLAKKKLPCLIPHAIDQDPHFRVTRDILPRIGQNKPASIQTVFLPPLVGAEGKMSSSGAGEHAIFATDDAKTIEKKIKKYAFSGGRETIEEHRTKGGNPDIDVSYQYLRMLFEPSDSELERIYNEYKSGRMLTSELKKITIERVQDFLDAHQRRRAKAKKLMVHFLEWEKRFS